MGRQHFRANVATIVVDSGGRVMAFERSDFPGEWQLPQGGIDDDESPLEAAWRELEEETGLTDAHVELVAEFPEWTAYTYPDGSRTGGCLGQVQRWFTFEVLDDEVEPRPDGIEFVDWKWVEPQWIADNTVAFRRAAYRRVLLSDQA